MLANYDLESKKKIAKYLAGIESEIGYGAVVVEGVSP